MENSSDEAGVTFPFANTELRVKETESPNDGRFVARSLSLDPVVLTNFDNAEGQEEEFVTRTLRRMSGEIDIDTQPACATDTDDEIEEMFVVVLGDICGEEGAESEGFTFADALMRADFFVRYFYGGCLFCIQIAIVLVFILQSRC